ncbi:hypothetical protein OG900_09390 [Streptomyces sp. NBC_00433]
MTSQNTHPVQSPPAVLELALTDGDMRALHWLATVRAAAGAGVHHLVLAGPHPGQHPAARALWQCGTSAGMHVAVTASPPATAADRAPRIRITADGIPRLVIPDGIPLTDLPTDLGPDLAAFASPPVLRALEAATSRRLVPAAF